MRVTDTQSDIDRVAQHSFTRLPSTKAGRMAAWTFVVFLIAFGALLYLLDALRGTSGPGGWYGTALLPVSVVFALTGILSPVLALFALINKHERSWATVAALLPLLGAIVIMATELVTHLILGE